LFHKHYYITESISFQYTCGGYFCKIECKESGYITGHDIGTEELGHLEMIGSIVTQLTKGEGARSFDKWGRGDYYVDHANAVFPASASGVPWTAAGIQSKGDVIADLMEDMAAEGAIT